MIIHTQAVARAGLIGNPSDGYFGKTISVALRNFGAQVACYESPRVVILPTRRDRLEFDSVDSLVEDVRRHGYYGAVRLIKATIKRFGDECRARGLRLASRNFTIEYTTDIPVRVGLAGSSAIITSVMRALTSFYEVEIPDTLLPNLIMSVETEELGIAAGLQDRVIQVYEGVVFMDFDRQQMQQHGHGAYESLSPDNLPPLFVAYHETLAEGTEVPHNNLRARFEASEAGVLAAMDRFAQLAQEARDHIVAGRGERIAPLMDANFDQRAAICLISEGNRQLVETGRRHGAAVKFAGSGGAVIGCYDGDPKRLARIRADYEAIGARLFEPMIQKPVAR